MREFGASAVTVCNGSKPPLSLHIYDQFALAGLYELRVRLYTALSRVSMMLLLIIFAHVASALPLGSANGNAVTTPWTFPNETWIENLAFRANNAVLCTALNRAAIYQVDPFSHVADMVHQFQSTDGVLGISEVSDDVFVAVTANVSLKTNTAWPVSAKVWRLDLAA